MDEKILSILERYKNKECTAEEVAWLFEYIQSGKDDVQIEEWINASLLDEVPESFKASPKLQYKLDHLLASMKAKRNLSIETNGEVYPETNSNRILGAKMNPEIETETKKLPIRKISTIAASILLALSIGLYIYKANEIKTDTHQQVQYDANPGSNKAILTLADGSTVTLSDKQSGIIIGDQDIKYTDGTSLFVIQSDSEGSLPARQVNTLTLQTPKAGQYQITLPDGTKVWLNAASTLKYPARFIGAERRVELSGEAYFEVASLSSRGTKNLMPFIVISNEQEIKVLGTHFNINTYKDEGAILTTLVEGSIQVSTISSPHVISTEAEKPVRMIGNTPSIPAILIPGQQSIVTGNTIKTRTVNPIEFTAWKDDVLIFKKTNLITILLTLSRWYDFKVNVADIPNEILSGEVPRTIKLSEVLDMLQQTSSVKLKIVSEGIDGKERRVILDK